MYCIHTDTHTHTHHQFVQACGAMAATKEPFPATCKTPRGGRAAGVEWSQHTTHPWPFMPPPDAAATNSPAAQPPPPTNYDMADHQAHALRVAHVAHYAQGYQNAPVFPPPHAPAPPQKKARKRAKSAAPDAAFAATAAPWAHHYSAWGVYPPPHPMDVTPGRSGAVAHGYVMPPSFFPLSPAGAASWPCVSIAPPTLAEICRARELENTFYLKSKELQELRKPYPTASGNEATSATASQDSSWNGNMGDAGGGEGERERSGGEREGGEQEAAEG